MTSPRPSRSPIMVGLGTFLLLAAGALVLVIVAGDRAPLWMIGAWFLLALALALVVGALVPVSPLAEDDGYDRGIGIDPAITGEPREEQSSSTEPLTGSGPSAQ